MKFFNEVAREVRAISSIWFSILDWLFRVAYDSWGHCFSQGGVAKVDEDVALSPLARLFDRANVFTVWRPTSDEAIKNMMLGIATGKGLDIKGKSAKRGNIR